jgi:hypothetical protein
MDEVTGLNPIKPPNGTNHMLITSKLKEKCEEPHDESKI